MASVYLRAVVAPQLVPPSGAFYVSLGGSMDRMVIHVHRIDLRVVVGFERDMNDDLDFVPGPRRIQREVLPSARHATKGPPFVLPPLRARLTHVHEHPRLLWIALFPHLSRREAPHAGTRQVLVRGIPTRDPTGSDVAKLAWGGRVVDVPRVQPLAGLGRPLR